MKYMRGWQEVYGLEQCVHAAGPVDTYRSGGTMRWCGALFHVS
jgi:hypothetical protein